MAACGLLPMDPSVAMGTARFAPPKWSSLQPQRASTTFPGCGHTVWILSGSPEVPQHRAVLHAKDIPPATLRNDPPAMLRSCSAPQAAAFYQVSTRSGTTVNSCGSTAAGNVPPKVDEAPPAVEGLEEFLRWRGLDAYTSAAQVWCRETGAAFMEEVLENRVDLADTLGLGSAERGRLLGETPEGAAASKAASQAAAEVRILSAVPQPQSTRPAVTLASPSPAGLLRGTTVVRGPGLLQSVATGSLGRTTTAPTTAGEVTSAEVRATKAYVPLGAWRNTVAAPTAVHPVQPIACGSGLSRSLSVEAQRKAEAQLLGPDTGILSHRQHLREAPHFYRMRDWSPPRYRVKDGETLHALRQRIPTAAELNALSAAQQRLGQTGHHTSDDIAVEANTLQGDSLDNVEDLRSHFLAKYGQQIRTELPGVTLQPTSISGTVGQRFLKQCCKDASTIQAAYHGTDENNYPSIFAKGLCVPGHKGVSVKNGSAHGVGIYTATLGNSGLSANFASSDSFLVCAVADNNGNDDAPSKEGKAIAASVTARWTGAGPSGSRFHRNHHQPGSASAAAAPKMMGRHQVHKETADVRHVGGAMVIFDESRVAPLFVANGIGKRGFHRPVTLWPAGGSPNMQQKGQLPGGGLHSGTQQAIVGGKHMWLPPEECRFREAIHLRRRIEAKARDVDRRAHRDAKALGVVHG